MSFANNLFVVSARGSLVNLYLTESAPFFKILNPLPIPATNKAPSPANFNLLDISRNASDRPSRSSSSLCVGPKPRVSPIVPISSSAKTKSASAEPPSPPPNM